MRERALAWASQYSLEGLREALRSLMIRQWGVSPEAFPSPAGQRASAELAARRR